MTDSPDYRRYLEEKFEGITKHINAQFQIVHERLESIEEQTRRTNGTVTEHSKVIAENLPHTVLHCSQSNNIEVIKKAISKMSVITNDRKYRFEQFLKTASFIVIAIGLCLTAYFGYRNLKKAPDIEKAVRQEIRNQEGVSSVTRSGNIKYNNQGFSDSVSYRDIMIIKQLRPYIEEIIKTKK